MQVKWGDIGGDSDDEGGYLPAEVINNGIVLTIGFVPGLKVDAIPLLQSVKVKILVQTSNADFLLTGGVLLWKYCYVKTMNVSQMD